MPASRAKAQKVPNSQSDSSAGRKRLDRRQECRRKGLVYAYRDRKAKKRDFRAVWIQRINAGARLHGNVIFPN